MIDQGSITAKFYYVGPTGPDQTKSESPTRVSDKVWLGPSSVI